jgi:hypothetical protein
MFRANVVEKIKTHVLYSIKFFFEYCAFNEIMWKYNAERCRPEMKIWPMRIACWIHKATNTHSKYIIFIDFPLQDWCIKAPEYHIIRTEPSLPSPLMSEGTFKHLSHIQLSWFSGVRMSITILDSLCPLIASHIPSIDT